MKNLRFYLVVMTLGLVVSCTSSKKVEDDEFAADGATTTETQTASADGDTSEFDLDQNADQAPTANATSSTPAAPGDDDFAQFEQPADNGAAANPSGADEFAEFDQAQAANQAAQTPTPEVLPEPAPQATEPPPIPAEPVAQAPVDVPVESPAQPVDDGVAARIQSVNYQPNQNGGAISIQADKPLRFTTRLNAAINQLVVEVPNSVVPAKLKRSLNTKDMASSIGSVDIYQKAGSKVSRFVVQLRPGAAEPLIQPEGNSLLIIGAADATFVAQQQAAEAARVEEDTPPEPTLASGNEQPMSSQNLDQFLIGNEKFYGKKISIETNNLEVKEAIKFIAEESGVNLLMDEGINGSVSLKLKQVPWDQALILILKARKLGYIRQGNVLRIAKLTDLQAEEVEAYKLLESRRNNEPLIVKRFFISYAKLAEMEAKIREFVAATAATNNVGPVGSDRVGAPAAGSAGAAATNQRGKVISDERTGSLIITDTPDNMSKIEKLITALDTQPKQVMIESRLVNANETFTRAIGFKWASDGVTTSTTGAKVGLTSSAGLNGANGGLDFTWKGLDMLGNLTATIALGELQNKVKVLSTNRTTVTSGQAAPIDAKNKLRIPVIQTNTTTNTVLGTTSYTEVEHGLTGTITPQASNENTVSADIKVAQTLLTDANGSTATETIGGRVVSPSGKTVVAQANFKSTSTVDESGVPGLKEIPILGSLFKGRSDVNSKSETLLFVTMYILEPLSGVKKASNDLDGVMNPQ